MLRVPRIEHEARTALQPTIGCSFAYKISTHASCVCNEYVSLHNRHLVDRSYLSADIKLLDLGFKLVSKAIRFKVQKMDVWDVVRSYTGAKKRSYWKAALELRYGFKKQYANLNMFIKPDRWPEEIAGDKPPRAIQYRRPHFNLKLAQYLKPFEDRVYEEFQPFGTRVIAKGLNLRQRGELFMDKIKKFKNPRFYCIDHSKFDSTVSVEHLQRLHKIYRRCVGKSVQQYLKHQYKALGYTKHGIKYKVKGTRCSGDFDTGLGNSLISAAAIMAVFKGCRYDFMLDGDDTVVILEGECSVDRDSFARFGLETKLNVVHDKYHVEFCQSRLIWNRGYMFSRNPLRAISHQCYTVKRYGLKGMIRYLAGVGRCEVACSAGVPLLQKQGMRYGIITDNPLYEQGTRWKMQTKGWAVQPLEILMETRITFARAWGISVDLQLAFEDLLLPVPLSYVKTEVVSYSGFAERRRVKVPYKYNAEQLFAAWQGMATMGYTSGPVWWGPG